MPVQRSCLMIYSIIIGLCAYQEYNHHMSIYHSVMLCCHWSCHALLSKGALGPRLLMCVVKMSARTALLT